jgi:methylglutaconyl-CoA hydratase
VVALNRPDVRNAFNAEMIGELTEAFTALSESDTRVVLLRGNGSSFSAGADVTWMRQSLTFTTEENLEDARRMSDMFAAIDTCRKPVVARIHGAALGGGMGLAAAADVVVADSETIFGFTETKLGIIPAVISRFVLPKIGESWARALFLTGERFGADLARHIGLVHWVAAPGDLDMVVDAKVNELLGAGPAATEEAKALIAAARGETPAGLRELTAQRIAALRTSPEGQEGLAAFLERRAPSWRQ